MRVTRNSITLVVITAIVSLLVLPSTSLASGLAGSRVTVSLQSGSDGRTAIGLSTDSDLVAAIVMSVPERGQAVAVRLAEIPEIARGALPLIQADATVEVGAASLAGLSPLAMIQEPLHSEGGLTLTLLLMSGEIRSYTAHGSLADIERLELEFKDASSKAGGGGPCFTVTLNCSGGCHTSQECCTPSFCADCVACSIICGQPCVIEP